MPPNKKQNMPVRISAECLQTQIRRASLDSISDTTRERPIRCLLFDIEDEIEDGGGETQAHQVQNFVVQW